MAPVRLVRPVAVAARDGDVYVADAGAGVLYRVDLASQQFVRVLGVRVDEGTRLAIGVDRVLHVLDRAARRIVRLSPGGPPAAGARDRSVRLCPSRWTSPPTSRWER